MSKSIPKWVIPVLEIIRLIAATLAGYFGGSNAL